MVTLWLLRGALLIHAAMAVAQPITAGSYMSGNYDMLQTHGTNGTLLLLATFGWGAAAAAYVGVRRGAGWPVLVLIPVVFLTEGIQIGMGHERNLAVHIPLGVFIVLMALMLAAWSFTPWASPSRRRGTVASKVGP